MKILIDMNLSPTWVRVLNEAGFEASHWSTVGAADADDVTIFAYAKIGGFVVLTHDLDFGAILAATGGDKPSVVQIRAADINPAVIGPQVVAALQQMSSELQLGALLTVEPGRARVRLLPLRQRS
jgi:predicted nuclease of predicted toxin-antitoxin system